MLKLFDLLKRKILFFKYKKVTLNLSDEDYAFIIKDAKSQKITLDSYVEKALETYIKLKENEKCTQ